MFKQMAIATRCLELYSLIFISFKEKLLIDHLVAKYELRVIMRLSDYGNHLVGYEATLQIPQVFPLASLTNPDSPQLVPHEFLTHQY